MCKSHTKKIGALKLSQQDVGKNCIFRGCDLKFEKFFFCLSSSFFVFHLLFLSFIFFFVFLFCPSYLPNARWEIHHPISFILFLFLFFFGVWFFFVLFEEGEFFFDLFSFLFFFVFDLFLCSLFFLSQLRFFFRFPSLLIPLIFSKKKKKIKIKIKINK